MGATLEGQNIQKVGCRTQQVVQQALLLDGAIPSFARTDILRSVETCGCVFLFGYRRPSTLDKVLLDVPDCHPARRKFGCSEVAYRAAQPLCLPYGQAVLRWTRQPPNRVTHLNVLLAAFSFGKANVPKYVPHDYPPISSCRETWRKFCELTD
jgi:hypothetical protein